MYVEKSKRSISKLNQKLKKSKSSYGIGDIAAFKKQNRQIFVKFEKYINKIGIFTLPKNKYLKAQKDIGRLINKNGDIKIWNSIFKNLIFRRKNHIFLRGLRFYNWLPTHIFKTNNLIPERWDRQLGDSIKALEIINQNRIVLNWNNLSVEEQILILCILDHFKNGIYFVLNNLYSVSVEEKKTFSNQMKILNTIAEKSSDLYYGMILNKPRTDDLTYLLENFDLSETLDFMKKIKTTQNRIRELDDPYLITLSALTLIEKSADKQCDMVISFPYGGIELGFALRSMYKILQKNKKPPDVIHCLYSSKKILRDKSISVKRESKRWLFNFIPKYYHGRLNKALKNRERILLYDNNVTTFKSLAEVKGFIYDNYKLDAEAAVVAVYFKNISRYILGKKSEPLIPNWETMLDYRPVADYITAFNTWGTSKKGRILEKIFAYKNSII